MSHLDLLVIERNDLTALTVESAKHSWPDMRVTVVQAGPSRINTALVEASGLTLVVEGGVILTPNIKNVPSPEVLKKYHLAVSRAQVFVDHPSQSHTYGLLGYRPNRGRVDLGVFIVNPDPWSVVPQSDEGFLDSVKKLWMPRYMNHRTDIVLREAMGAWPALQYGIMGLGAAVHNYVPLYIAGRASPVEMYGCCLDFALPYVEKLPKSSKDRVYKLARKTQIVASRLRNGLRSVIT